MKKAIALTVIMGASLLLAQNKEVNSPDFALSGGNELIKLAEDNVLVFRENGTLKVTGSGYVEILAVGGGGGGGARGTYGSGGGGAGGVVHQKEVFVEAGEYAITIGEGGGVGINGGITSALGINAYGGGAGRMADSSGKGNDGASGGGAAMWNNGVPNDVGGAAIYAEYNNMGNAGGGTSNPFGAGGGGGAGEAGGTPVQTASSTPGCGGNGYECDITGEATYYAGGGAAFRQKYDVRGGLGGGGSCVKAADEQSSTPGPGADGLGGGGCGGANGGSGVFIVRYKASFETVFTGAEGGVKARRKGRYVHTFANDDVFTMPVDGVVDILLVGGGGGGGANRSDNLLQGGAGGGAGGVVHIKGVSVRAGAYAIKIGSGGSIGANGENTEAFGYVAYGGGAGAKYDGRGSAEVTEGKYGYVGSSGGSGGGSTHVAGETWTDRAVAGGLAIHGEEGNLGNAGGITTHQYAASGGGGAGGTGGNSNGTAPGVGGIGYSCDISGVSVYYAGGGAGFRSKQQIDGGLGGGGSCVKAADGQSSTPGAGEDGLGGGGCGGAKGGSGIVIVSYQTPPVPFRVIVK